MYITAILVKQEREDEKMYMTAASKRLTKRISNSAGLLEPV